MKISLDCENFKALNSHNKTSSYSCFYDKIFLQKLGSHVIREAMSILLNCLQFPENVTLLQRLDLAATVNWFRQFAESIHKRQVKIELV